MSIRVCSREEGLFLLLFFFHRSNNLEAYYKVIPTEYQLISVTGNAV